MNWQHIETAPRDGTKIIVCCPSAHGLSPLICTCAYDDSGGFCVDELREPTHWAPADANSYSILERHPFFTK